MIKSYITITLRYLWRNRLFTALNVIGLTVGITACWSILRIVNYELSFDRKIPGSEQIFRVVSRFKSEGNEGVNAGVPIPLNQAVKEQIAGVKYSIPVWETWKKKVYVASDPKKTLFKTDRINNRYTVSGDYFNMIPYKWLAGNPEKALSAKNQVVITSSRAEKYFPGKTPADVLGQTLVYEDSVHMTVSGVVEDLKFASSFPGQEFFPFFPDPSTADKWSGVSSNNALYIVLNSSSDRAKILKQINDISIRNGQEAMKKYGFSRTHELLPIADIHFASEFGENMRKADKKVLYGLAGIAAFILLLACINYVNLSTAQLPQRSKEIGIRKTLGSSAGRLIRRFLGETFAVTLFSAALACLFSIILFNTLKDLIPEGIENFVEYWQLAAILVGVVAIVTLLSGIYPAWLVTRMQTIAVLHKQSNPTGRFGINLRKSLIVFQFFIAQVFIAGAFIVSKQLNFLLSEDPGFNKEAVILVNSPWAVYGDQKFKDSNSQMKGRIEQVSGVGSTSIGDQPLSTSFSSNTVQYKDPAGKIIDREIQFKTVDTAMIPLYNMKLLAGKNFTIADTTAEYIINETALKTFGFKNPQEAVGQYLNEMDAKPVQIVGVVQDFHAGSFRQKIDPLILRVDKFKWGGTFNIKLSGNTENWEKSIAQIETIWKSTFPDEEFKYEFYDTAIANIYSSDRNMAKIINLATTVAVLISCLGLFGLSTLVTYQRFKEIGVRKVLGATVSQIVTLLSADFVKLVAIAMLLAVPLSWYLLTNWLSDFAYSISLQWWMFGIVGIAAIAVALVTVSYQAIRAATTNPVDSLRSE